MKCNINVCKVEGYKLTKYLMHSRINTPFMLNIGSPRSHCESSISAVYDQNSENHAYIAREPVPPKEITHAHIIIILMYYQMNLPLTIPDNTTRTAVTMMGMKITCVRLRVCERLNIILIGMLGNGADHLRKHSS